MRKRRCKREPPKAQQVYCKRKHQCLPVLILLGLEELFDNLPPTLKQELLFAKFPGPCVVLDEIARSHPHATTVAQAVKNAFEEPVLRLPGDDVRKLTLGQFFTIVVPISWTLDRIDIVNQTESPLGKLDEARRRLASLLDDLGPQAIRLLNARLDDIMVASSRIEKMMLWAECHTECDERHRVRWHIEVHGIRPVEKRLCIDGKRRVAFQCGASLGGKFIWNSCTPRQLGLGPCDDKYPVYVQSHAIEHLDDRLQILGSLAQDSLFCSFLKPVGARTLRGDGCVLLQGQIRGHHVGYYVVRFVEDCFLVHTFLFITMEGTPECERLRRRLRIEGPDREHLRWDRLETFLHGDLKDDQELRTILRECGLDHLFQIVPEEWRKANLQRGGAGEAKGYLGPALRAWRQMRVKLGGPEI